MKTEAKTNLKYKLENFKKAVTSLEEALDLPIVHDRDRAGIVQNFEFVYETCWKALKAFLEHEGKEIKTPREAILESFASGFITDEALWLRILKDRNLTTHTYDQQSAKKIVASIKDEYAPAFSKVLEFLIKRNI